MGSQQVASWAVVVDAKAGAREFYLKHDFVALPLQSERLFLAMGAIERLFGGLRAQDERQGTLSAGECGVHSGFASLKSPRK